MATVGAKATPASLKLLKGNPGKRPVKQSKVIIRQGALIPPFPLTETQQKIWTRYIDGAWWLTEADTPKAFAWTLLQDELGVARETMSVTRMTQWRTLGSELGFDPTSRARMNVAEQETDDPNDGLFD